MIFDWLGNLTKIFLGYDLKSGVLFKFKDKHYYAFFQKYVHKKGVSGVSWIQRIQSACMVFHLSPMLLHLVRNRITTEIDSLN